MAIMNNFPSSGAAGGGYVIGTYTGNGMTYDQGGQQIDLGFRPKAVVLKTNKIGSYTDYEKYACWLIIDGTPALAYSKENPVYPDSSMIDDYKIAEIVDNGFLVCVANGDSDSQSTNCNQYIYMYIAFK